MPVFLTEAFGQLLDFLKIAASLYEKGTIEYRHKAQQASVRIPSVLSERATEQIELLAAPGKKTDIMKKMICMPQQI
eukprot:3019137-Amphidinium_carterae.1